MYGFLRLAKKKARPMRRATPKTPPITAPAMVPAGGEDERLSSSLDVPFLSGVADDGNSSWDAIAW